MSLVYLNGEFKPLSEASVNVLDRGFTFGDGVYEVIPVFNRTVFRLDEHLQRLDNSLTAIYMDNPHSVEEWHSIFKRLIDSVEEGNQSLYLQITRGVSERDHDISLADKPTVFVIAKPIVKKDFSSGIKAITHDDIRWSNCDIKAITLLPSVLLRHRAKLKEAKEAILVKDDYVTEGAASNVFVVKNNIIYTTPKDKTVLPGITRDLLLELLEKNNVQYREERISKKSLLEADEIWVTSSTWEIVPVIQLDKDKVGDGKVGPMWYKANELYQEFKHTLCD